jgi:hypothetical protein
MAVQSNLARLHQNPSYNKRVGRPKTVFADNSKKTGLAETGIQHVAQGSLVQQALRPLRYLALYLTTGEKLCLSA